jgi:hypothetical protein
MLKRRDSLLGYLVNNEVRLCLTCWKHDLHMDLEAKGNLLPTEEEVNTLHFQYVEDGIVAPILGSDIGPYSMGYYCDFCGERLRNKGTTLTGEGE